MPFDCAAFMAAMLRSQGIPAKVVVGKISPALTFTTVWVEVYSDTHGTIDDAIHFDGSSWVVMDPFLARTPGYDPLQYRDRGYSYDWGGDEVDVDLIYYSVRYYCA